MSARARRVSSASGKVAGARPSLQGEQQKHRSAVASSEDGQDKTPTTRHPPRVPGETLRKPSHWRCGQGPRGRDSAQLEWTGRLIYAQSALLRFVDARDPASRGHFGVDSAPSLCPRRPGRLRLRQCRGVTRAGFSTPRPHGRQSRLCTPRRRAGHSA